MNEKRVYVVRAGRHGKMEVIVSGGAIALRGERYAVAQAAWYELLGKNELGEDVNKNLATRKEIMTILLSRQEHERPHVFDQFMDKIEFTWTKLA